MTTEPKALPPTVLTMVRDRLIDDGYDGLTNEEDCGCDLENLAPCSSIGEDCRAGYKVPCTCGECDWHIVAERPDADGESGVCGLMPGITHTHPPQGFMQAEPTSASPPRFYPPPGVAVSEWCRTTRTQLCHICDDLACGDNLVERLRQKAENDPRGVCPPPLDGLTGQMAEDKGKAKPMRKPSVTGYGGQYDKLHEDDDGGGTVEWQPGDATRYLLVAKVLDVAEARLFGASPDVMIVAVGAGGERMLALVLEPHVLHHLSWVREHAQHLKFTDYTILAYTALLNLVLGDELYGVELFGEMIKHRNG
jgi:hypothetical protein